MSSQPTTPAPRAPSEPPPARKSFVVAVGLSAGGLRSLAELLKPLPSGFGSAVLIVQHRDAAQPSELVEQLAQVSTMPVSWAEQGTPLETGRLYVAPSDSFLHVEDNTILLRPEDRPAIGRIDGMLLSLAKNVGERAVAVLLSGHADDGTIGARAVKAAGGLVFAQNPESAAFPGLPRAAVEADCVDRVLQPREIADELIRLAVTSQALWDRGDLRDDEPDSKETDQFAQVFRLLATRTGVDFGEYKQSTIKRRLIRRMVLSKAADLASYLKTLEKSREEQDTLYENLLINVTEFFRDGDAFQFLQEEIVPAILARHEDGSPIRIWVPGCSTGEEAYSLAIAFREALDRRNQASPVQIFGTDISERALAVARAGVYCRAEVQEIPAERLKRYFHETERGFAVRKPVRDMCVFARQNVGKDSPFSRLDLISCRNLLIYLNPGLQRKLMPVFHYALNPAGYLMLGTSESVGSNPELFRLVDRRYRIYQRKPARLRAPIPFTLERPPASAPLPRPAPVMPEHLPEPFDIIREADRILLSRLGATGVLINEELDILQFRGDVSPYLAPLEGRASLNLLKMARDGLASELEAAVLAARQTNLRVHRTGLSVLQGNVARPIDIDVTPIDTMHPRERYYLLLFSSAGIEPPAPQESESKIKAKKSVYLAQIEQLRHDLQATRHYLQSTIEKHEATNQELRAANEEIQSSNEELQSTNEELETAKEELQSTNEELTTVNEELHSRQLELMQVNNDLNNLINSVHLPIIILGHDLRIRRFTPMAERVLKVIPTDIGRPLTDINSNLNIADLPRLTAEVIDSLMVKELEIQDNHGRWYSMRLRPYKTSDNKIDGVVITLIDIDDMKRTIASAEEARDLAQALLEAAPEAMAAVDAQARIRFANDAFRRLFQIPADVEHFDALKEGGALAELRPTFEESIRGRNGTGFEREVKIDGVAGGGSFVVTGRQITPGSSAYPAMLLAFRRR